MTVTIAMVEDDEAILDSVRLMLEFEGWDVWVYQTGEAFLEDARAAQADCIILDPHLPGMNGAEVARSTASWSIPLIGLTARPSSPITLEMNKIGVHVMLTKPVAIKDLVSHIQDALKASRG